MTAILTASIGVLGTLLGVIVTFRLQRSALDRTERINNAQRLRQDYINLFADFSSAAANLNRAAFASSIDWERRPDERQSDEYFRLLAAARHQRMRVRLITNDRALDKAAERALDQAANVRKTTSRPERKEQERQAEAALDAFLALAATKIHH